MKKYIVISDEVLESVLARLAEGKYVEGTLHRDKWTGNIVFNCWNRKPRQKQEEIDAILDKIRKSGYDSLTKEEKKKLFDQSRPS